MAKTEIEYVKARLLKRMLTYVIDLGVLAMMSFVLFALENLITQNTNSYKAITTETTEIRNSSGLYIDGVDIITYSKDEKNFSTYEERKNFLSSHIDSFYINENFFDAKTSSTTRSEYSNRKLNAKSDGVNLFIKEADVIKENAVAPEKLFNFYCDEITDHSNSCLLYNSRYSSLVKSTFWIVVAEVVVAATIMYFITYMLFPMVIFKRGRQTLGMKLMNIGLISYGALNVRNGVYVGRFFFSLIICFYLNFVAFLIPAIVSISMTVIGKTSPSLPNYVFNDYFVDTKNQEIYFDPYERALALENKKKISIENKEIVIKK